MILSAARLKRGDSPCCRKSAAIAARAIFSVPGSIKSSISITPLAKLADWRFLETRFGEAYEDIPGRPPLPTRLMAGLAILKHTYDLSANSDSIRPPIPI